MRPADESRLLAIRAAAILCAFTVLYCFAPPKLPLCGFRWLTGLPCPLCGLTRAMFALAKGHFAEAVRLHALSPLAAAMLVALVWNREVWPRYGVICAVTFGAYGILRML